jgi:hypothetical protein
MVDKSQIKRKDNSSHQIQLSKTMDKEAIHEIYRLINSPDFIDFVKTISETVDDGITYNEYLSSQIVLRNAKRILRKLEKEQI